MHPYHILKGSWLRLLNIFNVSGIQAAPLSHFGGVRVNCTRCFQGSQNSRCTPLAFLRGQIQLYMQCVLRFVEFQVHPYRILAGLGPILQHVFEVCGIPGAPLSHFGGVRVDVPQFFLRFVEFQVHPYRILEGSGSILLNVFEGCGVQSATLSHFDGLRITFTQSFCGLWSSRCNPIVH